MNCVVEEKLLLNCRFSLTIMIVVIAKHGYVDKQYCYFVIVSLELYRQRQRFMHEGVH